MHTSGGPDLAWLLLMVSLPPHPSSLRVWRRLRALGAVDGLYATVGGDAGGG